VRDVSWKPILLIEMLSYCNAFCSSTRKNRKSPGRCPSHPEAPGPSAAAGALELAALAHDARLLARVRAEAEVLEGLARVLGPAQQPRVGARRGALAVSSAGWGRSARDRLTTASSSRVRHSPPALTMRARAVRVKRSAATLSLGTSRKLRHGSHVRCARPQPLGGKSPRTGRHR
jgi:hypothetical protein